MFYKCANNYELWIELNFVFRTCECLCLRLFVMVWFQVLVCVRVWFRKRKRNEFVSSKVFMQLFQDKKVQESIFCIRMEWCERRKISKPKVSEREGVGITMWDHERQTERERKRGGEIERISPWAQRGIKSLTLSLWGWTQRTLSSHFCAFIHAHTLARVHTVVNLSRFDWVFGRVSLDHLSIRLLQCTMSERVSL